MTRDTDENPKGGDAKQAPGDSLTAGADRHRQDTPTTEDTQ